MPVTLSEVPTRQSLLILNIMGFDIARLQFYRWLIEHGRDPEFLDGAGPRDLQSLASLASCQPVRERV